MSAQLYLAFSYLSPGLILVGLSGLFWTMASGVVSPHSPSRLPMVLIAAVIGAFVGQVIAVHWGLGPAYGDFQPIGATFGGLALVVVVRRITA